MNTDPRHVSMSGAFRAFRNPLDFLDKWPQLDLTYHAICEWYRGDQGLDGTTEVRDCTNLEVVKAAVLVLAFALQKLIAPLGQLIKKIAIGAMIRAKALFDLVFGLKALSMLEKAPQNFDCRIRLQAHLVFDLCCPIPLRVKMIIPVVSYMLLKDLVNLFHRKVLDTRREAALLSIE